MTGTAEHLLHPRAAAEQLRAILGGAEHADGGEISALARDVLAERDDLRWRIANARAEIRLQSLGGHAAECGVPVNHVVAGVLAAVEAHLTDNARGGAS